MRCLLIFLALPICAFAGKDAAQTLPLRNASWRLVWSEEFNRNGPPDPRVWQFEQGFARNRELQWYQPANAVCHDGKLIIEGRREQVKNPNFQKNHGSWQISRPHADFTSASIISRENFAWKYGRFEIRARFPALAGLWPAIWTTGLGNWPHAGEIDIMEFYNGMILANTVHAGRRGASSWNASKHPIAQFDAGTWNDQFHLWVMEWSEKEIAIYLDGMLLNRVDLSKTYNLDGPGVNPFHAPHQLRLNLAIGGAGGDPSKTPFPQRYEVDYVRIYQER